MAGTETTLASGSRETESVANVLTASGTLDFDKERTTLRLPNGAIVHLATALLLESAAPDVTRSAAIHATPFPAPTGETIIPIVEERLHVAKQTIETGRVLLEKKILAYDETLDVPLAARSFEVERIVLNQPVDKAPPIRYEGLTTVYPLVEEQLILTTQLVLREELRITQHDTERRDTRTVTLKRETLDVTRTPLT